MARMGRGDVYTVFRWKNKSERYHLEDLGIDEMRALKWDFKI